MDPGALRQRGAHPLPGPQTGWKLWAITSDPMLSTALPSQCLLKISLSVNHHHAAQKLDGMAPPLKKSSGSLLPTP